MLDIARKMKERLKNILGDPDKHRHDCWPDIGKDQEDDFLSDIEEYLEVSNSDYLRALLLLVFITTVREFDEFLVFDHGLTESGIISIWPFSRKVINKILGRDLKQKVTLDELLEFIKSEFKKP